MDHFENHLIPKEIRHIFQDLLVPSSPPPHSEVFLREVKPEKYVLSDKTKSNYI